MSTIGMQSQVPTAHIMTRGRRKLPYDQHGMDNSGYVRLNLNFLARHLPQAIKAHSFKV